MTPIAFMLLCVNAAISTTRLSDRRWRAGLSFSAGCELQRAENRSGDWLDCIWNGHGFSFDNSVSALSHALANHLYGARVRTLRASPHCFNDAIPRLGQVTSMLHRVHLCDGCRQFQCAYFVIISLFASRSAVASDELVFAEAQ
jgi:hypothetical protein